MIKEFLKPFLASFRSHSKRSPYLEPLETRTLLSASFIELPGTLLSASFIELPGGSHVDQVALNGKTYYGGAGLYVTDGTRRGTKLVHPFKSAVLTPIISNGRLYFSADDGISGRELWRTDGTRAGTELVADIREGAESSGAYPMLAVGPKVYLVADDGIHGSEVFISDGSSMGTMMVADIAAGSASSYARAFAVGSDRRVYFTADDSVHGDQPWVTDGSKTEMIKDLGASNLSPSDFLAFHRSVYFSRDNELWKTNGTSDGTVLISSVKNLGSPRPSYSLIEGLHKFRGRLIFQVRFFPRFGEQINSALFRSDGSARGTKLLAIFGRGSSIGAYAETRSFDAFIVSRRGRTKSVLWRTDGTPQGSTRVLAFLHAATSSMAASSTQVFFVTGPYGQSSRLVVWRTDGTSSGTGPLATLPRFDYPWVSPIYVDSTLFVSISFFQFTGPLKPTHLYVIRTV